MTAITPFQVSVTLLWGAILINYALLVYKVRIKKQKFSEAAKCLYPSVFMIFAFGFGHLLIWTYLLTSGTITIK
jgi:uncharacterized protein (DUF486 family)